MPEVRVILFNELQNLLGMEYGQPLYLPCRGGWALEITPGNGGPDIVHSNPTSDGGFRFFKYTTVGSPNGAGVIEQAPPCDASAKK